MLRQQATHERAREVAAIAAASRKDHATRRRHFETLVAAAPDGWSYLNNFGTFELEGGDARSAAHLSEELNASNPIGYRGLREAARVLHDAALGARADHGLARLGAR